MNSVGIVTARDKLAIQWTPDDMRRVASDFAKRPAEEARDRYNLGPDSQDWNVSLAQQDVRSHPDADAQVCPILYRPFDTRATYYTGTARGFICRPREDVMRHMLAGPNLGMISTRQTHNPWSALATCSVIGHKALAAYDINYLFPLYLYPPEEDEVGTSSTPGLSVADRMSNLAPEFTEALADATGIRYSPGDASDADGRSGRRMCSTTSMPCCAARSTAGATPVS